MNAAPLTDEELDYLNDMLQEYGNDMSILDVSELDGFLTALIVSPEAVPIEVWYPAIWGGPDREPEFENEEEAEQLENLLVRMMHSLRSQLQQMPEEFTALFYEGDYKGEAVTTVEEWCFGFMRGVELAQWPDLIPVQEDLFEVIALHGDEENFPILESMSLTEHQESVGEIEPAVRSLFAAFHGRDPFHSEKEQRH